MKHVDPTVLRLAILNAILKAAVVTHEGAAAREGGGDDR
jgi:hypothetical protein